jgi:hypothetical protein
MPNIIFNALNISAHPHPAGVYRELFEKFSGKRVKYFGDKLATFSKPSEIERGIFRGYIITWTEIDQTQPMIDTALLETPAEEKMLKLFIPNDIGFNAQIFHYAFRISDHVLVFESRNYTGSTLSAHNAEKIFRKIFSEDDLKRIEILETNLERVEVDVFVEADAIERIFAISHLSSIEIQIILPNADDNTADTESLLHRLKAVKAGRQKIIYKEASSKVGLKPDKEMRLEGQAAIQHGYVKGTGGQGDQRITLNSKDYPKAERANVNNQGSVIGVLTDLARNYFKRPEEPRAN